MARRQSDSPVQRHRWTHHDKYNSTCQRCQMRAQKRPSPYGRHWWTEWRLPDGTSCNNYNGEPTPPCRPATGTPAAESPPPEEAT